MYRHFDGYGGCEVEPVMHERIDDDHCRSPPACAARNEQSQEEAGGEHRKPWESHWVQMKVT